ncbi:MAG: hypothetical protein HOK23_06030 [Euryarchaeota archaeon]|nr:hypothetical protein [Euryarchaeota archaeon]MBT5509272.1 hypothetical protein [Euryarchaeota archaeon]MBT7980458.1 hypothetical protein [Euryarchaeota archaeon]
MNGMGSYIVVYLTLGGLLVRYVWTLHNRLVNLENRIVDATLRLEDE